VASDNPVFEPPFVGSRVVKGMALDDVLGYLNETALFRNQWGFRPEKGESDEAFKNRVRAVLRTQLAAAREANVLVPKVVYGYWPANGDGNELIVWEDRSRDRELARFAFPRQSEEPYLCIADFLRPVESGELDYVAFHIVTMGDEVTEEALRLKAADRYQDYLFLHGLGVESTEALAEYWHRRTREEWGFAGEDGRLIDVLLRQAYRGGRYSWGYPACPDLEDNARVATLLQADRIGVEVSEEFQFNPEQTTSAIVCHHPQAKYFVAS
jgi:5-methyltetrahydrofolate--homocysteine methyltransferase